MTSLLTENLSSMRIHWNILKLTYYWHGTIDFLFGSSCRHHKVLEWEECGRKADCYLFLIDFCTLQRTTHKVGEDEDEKRAWASVWKKARLCLMNSRPMSNGMRGRLELDDRHLEGEKKVVGHSQCRGSVT